VTGRDALRAWHRAALDAVHAGRALERAWAERDPGPGPFVLLACGKAACAMAEAARRKLGPRIVRGHVTTKEGYARPLPPLGVGEAGHPLPDWRSELAARAALALAESLGPREELLVLLSGGASALWCAPAPGLTLEDKRRTNALLLGTPAKIQELNAVRRHLSAVKGGGLVRAAHGRRVHLFAVSDVRGDALYDLGSGPASADPTSFAQARAVLRAHGLWQQVPEAVRARIERGVAGELPETVKPGDPALAGVSARIVASLDVALEAAAQAARAGGLRVRVLRDALYGEVDAVARALAAEARSVGASDWQVLVAGGEPTVRVRGTGQGGRAQELALRLALELGDGVGFEALCAGSDGSDGPTSAAGAFSDSQTLARAHGLGLDPRAALARSDSHPVLRALGDLYVTGPTETNVGDLVLLRIGGPAG
jgi:glycerate 2-kinase